MFGEVCNLRWCEKTAFVLFLNKKDLFEIEIQKVPLSVCFEDYKEPNTVLMKLVCRQTMTEDVIIMASDDE